MLVHHLLLDADRPSKVVDVLREAGLISAEMLHEVGQAIRDRIELLVDGLFCTAVLADTSIPLAPPSTP